MDDHRRDLPPKESTPQLRGEAVLRFLENNPDFLIRHGFSSPTQKARVIDLGRTLIARARHVIEQFHRTKGAMQSILEGNRENTTRAHEAAYLLMAAATPGEVIAIIGEHFPPILGVAAARLIVAEGDALAASGGHVVARDSHAGLIKKKTMLGACAEAAWLWEGITETPPPSAAIIPLPEIMPGAQSRGILVLAGETADSFRADDGDELLVFTATMIAIALARMGGSEAIAEL